MGGGAVLNFVVKGRHFANVFVPALNECVQTVHEVRVALHLVIEVALLHVGPILCCLLKPGLDLRVYSEFNHGNLHVLARLRQVHL